MVASFFNKAAAVYNNNWPYSTGEKRFITLRFQVRGQISSNIL